MSISCILGFHRPSLASIMRRHQQLVGICEHCARPLVKNEAGKWTGAPPLDTPIAQKAEACG